MYELVLNDLSALMREWEAEDPIKCKITEVNV